MFENLDWQLAVRERALDMALNCTFINAEGRVQRLGVAAAIETANKFFNFLIGASE